MSSSSRITSTTGTELQICERDSQEALECAVCLQTCIHPVKLPCSHIFCFLCVKGVANQTKCCAMCRQDIPSDYFDNPNLLTKIEDASNTETYQWFYEGRNGWWQYEERTNTELENSYNAGDRNIQILVAGYLYKIDFNLMIQYRTNDPNRRRRIKRDLSSVPKKGVAGLKTENTNEVTDVSGNIVSSSISISSSSNAQSFATHSDLHRRQFTSAIPLNQSAALNDQHLSRIPAVAHLTNLAANVASQTFQSTPRNLGDNFQNLDLVRGSRPLRAQCTSRPVTSVSVSQSAPATRFSERIRRRLLTQMHLSNSNNRDIATTAQSHASSSSLINQSQHYDHNFALSSSNANTLQCSCGLGNNGCINHPVSSHTNTNISTNLDNGSQSLPSSTTATGRSFLAVRMGEEVATHVHTQPTQSGSQFFLIEVSHDEREIPEENEETFLDENEILVENEETFFDENEETFFNGNNILENVLDNLEDFDNDIISEDLIPTAEEIIIGTTSEQSSIHSLSQDIENLDFSSEG